MLRIATNPSLHGGRKKVKKMFLTMKNTKKGRQIKQKKGHRKICPTDIYLLII